MLTTARSTTLIMNTMHQLECLQTWLNTNLISSIKSVINGNKSQQTHHYVKLKIVIKYELDIYFDKHIIIIIMKYEGWNS